MKGFVWIAGLSAAIAFGSAAHATTNLVADGDFSTPATLSNGSWGQYSSPVTGWTDATDSIEIGLSTTYGLGCVNSACRSMEVNDNGFDTVSQTVSGLVVGQSYNIFYDYGGRPGGGVQELDVSFGGSLLTTNTGSLGAWTNEHFIVTATATSEILQFQSVNTASLGGLPSYGNEITNVSVSAVPEPGAWALLLAGFGGLALLGARRRDPFGA